MRARLIVATVLIVGLGGLAMGQAPRKSRLNPVIELLEQKKPVFGLYAPSNRRGGPPQPARRRAGRAAAGEAGGRAREGSGGLCEQRLHFRRQHGRRFRSRLPPYARVDEGHGAAGILHQIAAHALQPSVIVKTHEIAPEPGEGAARNRQAAQSRRDRHHVRRRRERRRSQAGPGGDALQVEGRHARGGRRQRRRRSGA